METTYALNENETLQEIKRPPRIGFIKTFAGTTPPEGTLLCDGSAVSRNTYSELFAAIGTTWGSGDGANTFNLPDLRDQWILCAGTEHEAGESVAEGLPNIIGTFSAIQLYREQTISSHGVVFGITNGAIKMSSHVDTQTGSVLSRGSGQTVTDVTIDANNQTAIYGASTHVTPASVAVLPCIVYE